jgi:ribosome-binding protein aMBF1 (putative translation factor)
MEDFESVDLIECDLCGRAFCGPGVKLVLQRYGGFIVCDDCVERAEADTRFNEPASSDPAPALKRRQTRKLSQRVA